MSPETRERAAVWSRVSTEEQHTANQREALERFATGHGWDIVACYDAGGLSAWTGAHRERLGQALDDARAGKYDVLVVWALDRLERGGIEATLRAMRLFREAGVRVVSLQEPWTDVPGETQQLLTAVMGWVAQMESARRSERVKAGLARRKAAGLPVGRQPGAGDKKPRRRSGYVSAWEPGGAHRRVPSQMAADGQQDGLYAATDRPSPPTR
jgi:putative DNA-invertase from lambdoid prophage Rac